MLQLTVLGSILRLNLSLSVETRTEEAILAPVPCDEARVVLMSNVILDRFHLHSSEGPVKERKWAQANTGGGELSFFP